MDLGDDMSDPVALITDPAKSVNNPNNPTSTAGFTFLGPVRDACCRYFQGWPRRPVKWVRSFDSAGVTGGELNGMHAPGHRWAGCVRVITQVSRATVVSAMHAAFLVGVAVALDGAILAWLPGRATPPTRPRRHEIRALAASLTWPASAGAGPHLALLPRRRIRP